MGDLLSLRKVHGYSCEDMPTVSYAKEVVEEHLDTKTLIENIGGVVSAGPDPRCPDKGFVEILFPSRDSMIKIEALLTDGTFFGVPTELVNY